jgi:hypothetical protein
MYGIWIVHVESDSLLGDLASFLSYIGVPELPGGEKLTKKRESNEKFVCNHDFIMYENLDRELMIFNIQPLPFGHENTTLKYAFENYNYDRIKYTKLDGNLLENESDIKQLENLFKEKYSAKPYSALNALKSIESVMKARSAKEFIGQTIMSTVEKTFLKYSTDLADNTPQFLVNYGKTINQTTAIFFSNFIDEIKNPDKYKDSIFCSFFCVDFIRKLSETLNKPLPQQLLLPEIVKRTPNQIFPHQLFEVIQAGNPEWIQNFISRK